jgi:23S rRNA (cytidine1920-2'-O)/16S rRNA (cytidine1409-2'-O)-methyltransferase
VASGTRLDQLLVSRGLVESRSLARRLILAGKVRVDGHPVDKPGTAIAEEARLEVIAPPRFVSRGGDKIAPVLDGSGIEVEGRVCIDIGASTGGFTDCLLGAGAAVVVAVDVGYGQLDWRLRQDPRVRVMERTNARYLNPGELPGDLPGAPTVAVMDVSFISAAKVLPALTRVCDDECDALILVKPQFEAGPSAVSAGGVVRSADDRRASLRRVAEAARELGWAIVAAHPSPLRGPAGNWECFLQLRRGPGVASNTGVVEDLEIPDDGR